jgi:prepilin-type N-terminal cleavage/methylation domain-containing protein
MNTRGLTLLEVIVVVAVITILAALLFPLSEPGMRQARKLSCANNLRQLHQLATHHSSTHPGEWPTLSAGGLWMDFARTTPPLLEGGDLEVLLCPVKGEPTIGSCGYRGPGLPWASLSSKELVAADKPGNHGEKEGGNVLRKDGSAEEAGLQDELWKECARKLFP